MELFSVICTTCQSRLKVRDRAAIGQILACPKCQGMVLVQPPAGWTDPGESATEQATSSTPVPVSESSINIAAASTTAIAASTFDDAAALFSPAEPAPPPATVSPPVETVADASPAAPHLSGAPTPVPLDDALAPNTDWTSPQTQRLKQWVLLGGALTTGAVVLITAGVYAVSALTAPAAPPAIAQANNTPEPIEEQPASPIHDPDDKPAPPVEPEQPPPMTESEADPLPTPPVPPIAPRDPVENPPAAPKPPTPANDNTPPELAGDPQAESPKPLNTFNVDKTLEQFGSLIEAQPFETQPAGDALKVPEASSEDDAASSAAEEYIEEPLPRPAARNVDVARRLEDRLEGLELTDVALADFLNFVTDLTLVPITLDPTALPAIRCSPETPLKANLKQTTVAEALAQALGPRNLAFVASDNQIVVLPVASVQGKPKTIKHDVTDLCATPEQASALAELVTQIIEPESWTDVEGVGYSVEGKQIVVTNRPTAHYAMVVLLDKLRLARKLPTRSPYPAEVITLVPKAIAADALLSTPVTMNFVPPTRIGKVGEHLKRSASLRMLVDWRAIGAVGWTPEGEVKAGVANQPLRDFLNRLTARMEIAWRVIDSQTVELTTPSALVANPDVEVYPVAVADGDSLVADLKAKLGAEHFAPGSTAALVYDARSQALIARLPQPAQRKLVELLAQR